LWLDDFVSFKNQILTVSELAAKKNTKHESRVTSFSQGFYHSIVSSFTSNIASSLQLLRQPARILMLAEGINYGYVLQTSWLQSCVVNTGSSGTFAPEISTIILKQETELFCKN
jgi:hypothetical protein